MDTQTNTQKAMASCADLASIINSRIAEIENDYFGGNKSIVIIDRFSDTPVGFAVNLDNIIE